MTHQLIIARDALRGFVAQKLLLALVVLSLGITLAFGSMIRSQERAFEAMNDVSIEEIQKHAPNARAGDLTRDKLEQGLEQMRTIQQAFFFGAAALGGGLVSLFAFGTTVASPLRRGEVRSIVARPVSRAGYLLGRYWGTSLALAGYWLMMSVIFWLFARRAHMVLPPAVHLAAPLYFCKCLMLGSIALALSLYVPPALAMAIAACASSDWVPASSLLYYLLPGDDRLSMASQILQGATMTPRDAALSAFYALDIAAVAVGFALLRFRRMDLRACFGY